LDLSRDKRELLVSYESDQIYTFPIFPHARSAAGPTIDEIDGLGSSDMSDDDNADSNGCMSMLHCRGARRRSGEDIVYNELASYGGHLNRFTFLKNAKYAGPNDEYICTGSDSGHAWIYERSSGAVVSLLNADHSTCNGVVPHPTLPIFITYGIDSTAKLWRGTPPVDPSTDDSASGRFRAFNEKHYEMSSLTRDWDTVEHELSNIEQELVEADNARQEDDSYDTDASDQKSLLHSYCILPDQVLSRKELINTGCFGRSTLRRFYGGPRIGNDLHSLPEILRRNQYECIRAAVEDTVGRRHDLPVESDLKELRRRVSLIRLRHQADRQGISGKWNAKLPWIFKKPGSEPSTEKVAEEEGDDEESDGDESAVCPHPADLVPDNPSDWIPYDPEMSKKYGPCGMAFDVDEYGDFYRERYLYSDRELDSSAEPQPGPWRKTPDDDEFDAEGASASEIAYKTLHETARVLKDGGNEALRTGDLDVAARRYDKAIRYCSVAFMAHHGASTYGGKYEEELMLISMKVLELNVKSDHNITPLMLKWSPLLKVLISTRLNLSMLLLKQAKHQKEVPQLEQAKDQARHALRELQPFCTRKGQICMTFYKSGKITRLCTEPVSGNSKVKTEVIKEIEPEETYIEAKTLEAKAYFRLGSAQSDINEYGDAIKSFDKSIECTLELNPNAKLDPLVVRRLAEAKREKARQNKRHRKKFRMMFAQEEEAANKKSQTKKCTTPCSKDTARRRTSAMVTPSSPVADDRGTQSE
jgi:tetratricopeptide (TPR) repeat protein